MHRMRHAGLGTHQAHDVRRAADVWVDADGHQRSTADEAGEEVEELVG